MGVFFWISITTPSGAFHIEVKMIVRRHFFKIQAIIFENQPSSAVSKIEKVGYLLDTLENLNRAMLQVKRFLG